MNRIILLVTLAIFYFATDGYRHYGSVSHSRSDSGSDSQEDDLIHPPWWHPKNPPIPESGGRNVNGAHNHGGKWPGNNPIWVPWAKTTSTTNKPRFTDSFYDTLSTTPTSMTSTSTTPRTTTSTPGTTTTIPEPSTSIPNSSSTPTTDAIVQGPFDFDLFIEECKKACPSTKEDNPVCGTDNITYENIGKLECAKRCFVDVQFKRRGPCATLKTPNPRMDVDLVAALRRCLRNCPVTSEYNPICGTDNVTYPNRGRLECAQNCGVDVQISRQTPCSVPPTSIAGTSDNTIAACIRSCPVSLESNPVCGSNNVTYPNLVGLQCAKDCGVDVQLSRKTSCSVPESKGNGNGNGGSNGSWNSNGNGGGNGNWNGNGGGNSNWNGNGNGGSNGNWNGNGNGGGHGNWNGNGGSNGNWNGHGNEAGNGNGNGRRPSVTEIIACMQHCPITMEINPVCGTDGVTYSNPGRLLCSQFCGVDVRVQIFAPCNGQPLTNPHQWLQCPTLTTPTEVPTKRPDTMQECINACPVSQTFKPVCGTNGVTYTNLESLQCHVKCGVAVSLLKQSMCESGSTVSTTQTPPGWGITYQPTPSIETIVTVPTVPGNVIQDCINNCFTTQVYKPVCGTNGETYPNLAKLNCAKGCGVNVDLLHDSACSAKDNGLGFTIPPDVLANLFPESVSSTTTKDSEEYDLDQRFGDETTKAI